MMIMKAVMKVFLLVWAVGATVVSTTEDADNYTVYEYGMHDYGTEATSICFASYLEDLSASSTSADFEPLMYFGQPLQTSHLLFVLPFKVLVISSLARGQNGTPAQHDNGHDAETDHPTPSHGTPAPLAPPQPTNQTISANRSADVTDPAPTTSTTENLNSTENDMTEEGNGTTIPRATTTASVPGGGRKVEPADVQTTVSATTMAQNTQKPVVKDSSNKVGYVVLVLIIIVIIVLCVILYFLRRVSRSYSFDLQRPVHNHLDEPTGTFEPVYLDDLDITAPKDQMTTDDLSPPPAANGTTVQSEENASNGDNAPQEQPEANGLEISLTSNTSPSLGNDPADKTPSPLSTSNLFLDATGEEQQNENNNNPSVSSSDPFVEINLDDPAWSDQLLTSPEASSSVLPFSPFSFSSSSS